MTSMYDKFENNTYEIKATAFTARGASFGFITRPLMHAPIVNQGKWGTITLHLTSGKGAAMAGDSYISWFRFTTEKRSHMPLRRHRQNSFCTVPMVISDAVSLNRH